MAKWPQENGGAVYLENGTVNIEGGTIKNCKARRGGAVYIQDGTVNLQGGIIDNNLAAGGNGGGVFIRRGSLTVGGSTQITNNSCEIKKWFCR